MSSVFNLMMGATGGSGGGGGGGGGEPGAVNWDNINKSGLQANQTGSTGDEVIDVAGTLNISYSLATDGDDISAAVIKNGISQGQVSSVSTSVGDTIAFSVSTIGLPINGSGGGTITVTGSQSDVIDVVIFRAGIS